MLISDIEMSETQNPFTGEAPSSHNASGMEIIFQTGGQQIFLISNKPSQHLVFKLARLRNPRK